MAEWFKAADLRPAINDAWVRTPLCATNPIQSNPTQKPKELATREVVPSQQPTHISNNSECLLCSGFLIKTANFVGVND